MALTLASPAKINWFLHITGKRHDGYHNLQTCFQFLDFEDTMHFERLPSPEIEIHGMPNVPLKDNLIFKASKVMQSFMPNQGVRINIEKNLPMGGGLGGGSSNAATTLVALNQLWDIHLSQSQLIELATNLGADVPVFIFGRGCVAEGIGEQMQEMSMPSRWLLLLIPDCQVSTKELFSHPELTTNTPPCKIGTLESPSVSSLRPEGFFNAFEPVVRKIYNPIDQAMRWLEQHGPTHLSGTGSCCFASFDDEQTARKVAKTLPSGMKGMVVKTLNQSPLYPA